MKRHWDDQELAERWWLTHDEFELLQNRTDRSRLGFAVLLKFFQVEGWFPSERRDVPSIAVDHLAGQLDVPSEVFAEYKFDSRSAKRDREQIRVLLGFRRATVEDGQRLAGYLRRDVLSVDHKDEHLRQAALEWCRENQVEPPAPSRIERILSSAMKTHEKDFFDACHEMLPQQCRSGLDDLLRVPDAEGDGRPLTSFTDLRADPGRVGLESVLNEVAKLKRIDAIELPEGLFASVPSKIIQKYRVRTAAERARELARHPPAIRYTLLASFCWQRRKEVTDGLVDLLIQVVHRIGVRSEKKVVKNLLEDLKKVHGKTSLLFKIAEAAVDNPDGLVKEVVYPVVGEQTLRDLIREFKSTGAAYQREVHSTVRSSYGSHYRRMLAPLLETLQFRSNNALHRPVIEALEMLKAQRESKRQYFSVNEGVPIDGVVKSGSKEIVIEKDSNGVERINRINYEICVLEALRERLRTKEIWVLGADRYRNPDDDVPSDFETNRDEYYAALQQPQAAVDFVAGMKRSMKDRLERLNSTLPQNPRVKIVMRGSKPRISIAKLERQPDPVNLSQLKAEVTRRWPMTGLLDVLKETDLRVDFTDGFQGVSSREVLARDELQRRLLLSLYGLGTNMGLKRVSASDPDITYEDLLYIRRKFIRKESLRSAISEVANAIFRVRRTEIWGEATTACASDSKKFGSWDQNLMTEWHIRYGGRGIMIYWHVEKKSVCIYSQLKRCSSSEVAAMIEGLLRHCTEMSVEKNYVDTHGQSDVAFAFCHLLGFELLPRLKGISKKKLYRVESGNPGEFPHLQAILTRPINWDLIASQYDEMVKYATALRIGTAETESILRRFTRDNLKHPTYQALIELGKAKRTMFICRYLESEALRQEIQEGLNVIESWNSTNGFIFFGKGGEVATNRLDDQEISVLSLHLLQICLVYINTLMIQNILSDPTWINRMTPEDFRAMSPLIHSHFTPYGSFELDMEKRLRLEEPALVVVA